MLANKEFPFASIYRYCVAGSSSSKRSEHSADCAKTCSGRPRKRRPTEKEFDHELRLWLKSKKSRKTHLDTRVEAAQSDREIARGRDVPDGQLG